MYKVYLTILGLSVHSILLCTQMYFCLASRIDYSFGIDLGQTHFQLTQSIEIHLSVNCMSLDVHL